MSRFIKKNLYIFTLLLIVIAFFWQFIIRGLLPIPSDTIVGLYHPFRDLYAKEYPRGIPFKNFLISDPVRQIIPWKQLSIDSLSRLELPLWSPYEMAGKPHLANFQSSAFYPLNLILFVKPFYLSWSIFVMIQPALAGLFMFAYLKNLKLDLRASFLGAITFSFSGFSIAWLEWGNIIHTALWLPLALLSIDRIVSSMQYPVFSIKKPWGIVFLFSLVASFFAGHPQIFFYVFIVTFAYLIFRWFEYGKKLQVARQFIVYYLLFAVLTAVQWIPTFQFLGVSARSLDQNYQSIEGWFIPWQHLVQFVTPDLFGNPTTLNYWGTWNYGELVGYVGIITLIFVLLSLASGVSRTKIFFAGVIVSALLFATNNPIARVPFELNIPFISSSQPTRLIFLMSFGLSVLAAIGFDTFSKQEKIRKTFLLPIFLTLATLALAWLVGLSNVFGISAENLAVLKRNLYFPTAVLGFGIILILIYLRIKKSEVKKLILIVIIGVVAFDLLRFGWKFTAFTKIEYFYPETRVIEFLKKDEDVFRIATNDSRILAPNIATFYKIQSIEGYDPLYLKSYAELVAASERGKPKIDPPFGFNRIITPHNVDSPISDLLNVKYVLSLIDLNSPKFKKVFQEGETQVYENRDVVPRAYFASYVVDVASDQKAIETLFSIDLRSTAVVDGFKASTDLKKGRAKITDYRENKVVIETENEGDGFLVLMDAYYAPWKVEVDGNRSEIHKTNYAFRGVFVPAGKHKVVFYDTLF